MATTPLLHWLRVLWGAPPDVRLDSDFPFIAAGVVHLPANPWWRQQRAAAAHATAHLVFSPKQFDGTGLPPITRTVLAVLEDARVEALAGRELPGLARLWRPLHGASPDDGDGFESLLRRLARALADVDYADPHPWVSKGRALVFLDRAQTVLALRTPGELRWAACRLGHDIGQMRLAFNPKTYRPAPAYRDDNRWMWPADHLTAAPPPPEPRVGTQMRDLAPADALALTRQAEWDQRIHRLRPDWCTVVEQVADGRADGPPGPGDAATWGATLGLARRLTGPLRSMMRPSGRRRRSRDGEDFDLDALLRWQIARRSGHPGDSRVYQTAPHRASRGALWLLLDQSASSAAGHGGGVSTQLQAAAAAAQALACACRRLGLAHAVAGFSSYGRHDVRLQLVKDLGEPQDHALLADRLQALRSGGSTRLGAALRHVSARLAAHPAARGCASQWLLLLSDADVHDIDVHEPRYLLEDARQSVCRGGRRSVRFACLTLAPEGLASARRIFGPGAACVVPTLQALPGAVKRLLT